MGGEWSHLELVGPGEGMAVALLTGPRVDRIGLGGDLTEESKGPCLVAALTALAGEPQGAISALACVLDPVREQVRLTELHDAQNREVSRTARGLRRDGLFQQRDALLGTSRRRICVTKPGHRVRIQERDVAGPALSQIGRPSG